MPERRKKLERAVVLAAGMGSRLVSGESYPKPLKPVAGVPLLVRVLRTLQSEGVREVVVVTGYMGEQLEAALRAEPSLFLSLKFLKNAEFDKKNGVSLLAAASYIDEPVILTMADHIFSPEVVRNLKAVELPQSACALAVDFDIDRCFDLDDATKVQVDHGRISSIGKAISGYNAIDTGVFRVGPSLVRELARLYAEQGDCSLSEGVMALAAKGLFHACDAGDGRWIDVDTPEALQRAEMMIRVFGDDLGDEPAAARVDADAMQMFAPSWVRAAQPYKVNHFQVADSRKDLLRLMSNESPFAPSQRVLNAILDAAMNGNRYPSSGEQLREKLGEQDGLGADNVTLGAGSTELIDLVIRTFVAPGEEVLLSVPTFSMYEARTRTVGGIPVLVPMTPEADYDISALIGAVTERTKLMFICTPNNPTGNRIDEASLRRLLRLGLPTVIDEAYFEFGMVPESFSYLMAEFPNAMFMRTFSKAYGLAGLRVGYLLSHADVAQLLSAVKIPWTVSSIAIAAATAALEDEAEQSERLRQFRDGRLYLLRELRRLPNVSVPPSDGNFVLADVTSTGVAADALAARMLEHGVMVRTLTAHHANRSMIRITVGTATQNARCVRVLSEALRALSRRPTVLYSA